MSNSVAMKSGLFAKKKENVSTTTIIEEWRLKKQTEFSWKRYCEVVENQILPHDDECEHKNTYYEYKQTRQSDEIETCWIICKDCGKRMKK